MTNIVIRDALIGDADEISHLIIQTLREINAKDIQYIENILNE